MSNQGYARGGRGGYNNNQNPGAYVSNDSLGGDPRLAEILGSIVSLAQERGRSNDRGNYNENRSNSYDPSYGNNSSRGQYQSRGGRGFRGRGAFRGGRGFGRGGRGGGNFSGENRGNFSRDNSQDRSGDNRSKSKTRSASKDGRGARVPIFEDTRDSLAPSEIQSVTNYYINKKRSESGDPKWTCKMQEVKLSDFMAAHEEMKKKKEDAKQQRYAQATAAIDKEGRKARPNFKPYMYLNDDNTVNTSNWERICAIMSRKGMVPVNVKHTAEDYIQTQLAVAKDTAKYDDTVLAALEVLYRTKCCDTLATVDYFACSKIEDAVVTKSDTTTANVDVDSFGLGATKTNTKQPEVNVKLTSVAVLTFYVDMSILVKQPHYFQRAAKPERWSNERGSKTIYSYGTLKGSVSAPIAALPQVVKTVFNSADFDINGAYGDLMDAMFNAHGIKKSDVGMFGGVPWIDFTTMKTQPWYGTKRNASLKDKPSTSSDSMLDGLTPREKIDKLLAGMSPEMRKSYLDAALGQSSA